MSAFVFLFLTLHLLLFLMLSWQMEVCSSVYLNTCGWVYEVFSTDSSAVYLSVFTGTEEEQRSKSYWVNMCVYVLFYLKTMSLLACPSGWVNYTCQTGMCSSALLTPVCLWLFASTCVFVGVGSLTVWSVSGGRTMVFSIVFITSFHSSFNTRFSTVFSQILANKVRLTGGGGDRGNQREINNEQQKEENTVTEQNLKKEHNEQSRRFENHSIKSLHAKESWPLQYRNDLLWPMCQYKIRWYDKENYRVQIFGLSPIVAT